MRSGLRLIALLLGVITLLITVAMSTPRADMDTPPSQWIAFVEAGHGEVPAGIYIARAVGRSDPRLAFSDPDLFDTLGPVSWSPDGQWLWFVGGSGTVVNLYRSRIGRDDLEKITGTSYAYMPTWAPDGQHLAYVSRTFFTERDYDELIAIDADTTDARSLARIGGIIRKVAWSPNSAWIALSVTERPPAANAAVTNIYRVRADGTDLEQLTDFDAETTVSDIASLAWTADGEWIIFGTYAAESGDPQSSQIAQVRSDGSVIQMLMQGQNWLFRGLSPDGQWLIAYRDRDKTTYRVRADASGVRPLTPVRYVPARKTMEIEQAWSPDGRWIAYRLWANGAGEEIRLVSADGQEMRRLTDEHQFPSPQLPAWSPPIDSTFRWWIMLAIGAAIALAGVAPWSRNTRSQSRR